MPKIPDDFLHFTAAAALRLEQGRETYGDRSFTLPPAELVREIEEELLDVAAWSFILWCRVRAVGGHIPQASIPGRPLEGL